MWYTAFKFTFGSVIRPLKNNGPDLWGRAFLVLLSYAQTYVNQNYPFKKSRHNSNMIDIWANPDESMMSEVNPTFSSVTKLLTSKVNNCGKIWRINWVNWPVLRRCYVNWWVRIMQSGPCRPSGTRRTPKLYSGSKTAPSEIN